VFGKNDGLVRANPGAGGAVGLAVGRLGNFNGSAVPGVDAEKTVVDTFAAGGTAGSVNSGKPGFPVVWIFGGFDIRRSMRVMMLLRGKMLIASAPAQIDKSGRRNVGGGKQGPHRPRMTGSHHRLAVTQASQIVRVTHGFPTQIGAKNHLGSRSNGSLMEVRNGFGRNSPVVGAATDDHPLK